MSERLIEIIVGLAVFALALWNQVRARRAAAQQSVLEEAEQPTSSPMTFPPAPAALPAAPPDTGELTVAPVEDPFARALAQRRSVVAPALLDADALLQDCYAPLVEHLRARGDGGALAKREPVSLFAASLSPSQASASSDARVAFAVAPSFGGDLLQWDALVLRASLQWFYDLDGFAASLYRRLELPSRMRVPDRLVGYDERSVYSCFGPWLPALFSEVLAAMQLGQGHAAALLRRYRHTPRVGLAPRSGLMLSAEPPAHLRFVAALAGLQALAQDKEARALRTRWQQEHPEAGEAYLPLDHQAWLRLESSYLEQIFEELVGEMLDEPVAALAGFEIVEVADLGQGPHEQRVQADLVPKMLRGTAVTARPRTLLGAALIGLEDERADERSAEVLLAGFRRALRPDAERPGGPRRTGRERPRSLAGGLRRDLSRPGAWREAVALGGAIGARPGNRRPFRQAN